VAKDDGANFAHSLRSMLPYTDDELEALQFELVEQVAADEEGRGAVEQIFPGIIYNLCFNF
jgi:hypothetical protein